MLGPLDRHKVHAALIRRLFGRRPDAREHVADALGRSRADPVRALPLRSPLAYPHSWAAREVARGRVRTWSARWVATHERLPAAA